MLVLKSVRHKLMIPTLVLTVLLLSLLGLLLALNSFTGIKSMLTSRAHATADFIAKVSINPFKNFEYTDLDNIVLEISKDPEVNFATFYDGNGVALTKETPRDLPTFIVVDRKIADDNGKNIGSLKIGFNRSKIDANLHNSLFIISLSILVAIVILLFGMRMLSERIIVRRIIEIESLSDKLANGDMSIVADTSGHDEIASLGQTMNKMAATLKELIEKTQARNVELEDWQVNELWLKSGLNDLNSILREERRTEELATQALNNIIGYLGAGVGVIYLYDDKDATLQAIATYALANAARLQEPVHAGEGLAGQVALERKMLCIDAVPHAYLPIASALGTADPLNIIVLPIMHSSKMAGVLELGTFKEIGSKEINFLQQATDGLAIALEVNRSRDLVNELLEQTQSQAEELRVQQEELQQTNEELAERARMFAETAGSSRGVS